MPFIFVYFASLGLTGEQVGLLSSMSPLMATLFATTISSFADRYHKRIGILRLALVCSGLTLFLVGRPEKFGLIAIMMLFWAFFSSPIMSLADSLIARMSQRRSINYGGMRLWGSFGFAVSALGFGALWQLYGFKPIFVVSPLLILPLVFIAGKLEEVPAAATQQKRMPVLTLFRDRGLLLILVATLFASISNSLSMTFSGIYAGSLGAGNFLIGMMTAFGSFAELPMMFFAEKVSARLGRIQAIVLSFGLMAAGYLGYTLVSNPNLLPGLAIIRGMGYGLWLPLTVRLVTDRTPEQWSSTSQSFLSVCMFGLAPLIAGPLGGLMHDAINPAAVFWLAVLVLVIAGFIFWVASARKQLIV